MIAQVHRPGAVRGTARLRARLDALYADVDPAARPTFLSRGRVCVNRRDQLWFGRRAASDGWWPLYRVFPQAYGGPRTRAKSGFRDVAPPAEMPAWLGAVLDRVSAEHGLQPLNHAVLHRYVLDEDTIGLHHDKPMDIAPGSHIVSLSVGAARTFAMRDVASGRAEEVEVRDGDLVVLPYALNLTAKHAVLPCRKRRGQGGVRYSITARHIDTHFDPGRRLFRHRESDEAVAY